MKFLKPIIASLLIAGFIAGFAVPVTAHEFWLEPAKFQAKTGDTIKVRTKNGQKFSGGSLGYFEDRVVLFDWLQNGTRNPVKSRSGDFPALSMPAPQDGLLVLAYQSTISPIEYAQWAKFAGFIEHKGFASVKTRHLQRGLPEDGFTEIYSRFAKTLIGVGDSAGKDQNFGMETEFIALTNPYTDDLTHGFSVQLLYQNQPRANAQIEIFERSPDKKTTISYLQTDSQGIAVIPVKAGYTYLLDGVVLREPSSENSKDFNAVWETLWASLTFKVP